MIYETICFITAPADLLYISLLFRISGFHLRPGKKQVRGDQVSLSRIPLIADIKVGGVRAATFYYYPMTWCCVELKTGFGRIILFNYICLSLSSAQFSINGLSALGHITSQPRVISYPFCPIMTGYLSHNVKTPEQIKPGIYQNDSNGLKQR